MPTYGPYSPSLVTSDSSAGDQFWSSPMEAASLDDSYTTCLLEDGSESYYLNARGFGAAIPDTETVTGVLVEIEGYASGTGVSDAEVAIYSGGAIGTSRHAGDDLPLAHDTLSYDHTIGEWGHSGDPAYVNSSDFAVLFRVGNDSGDYRSCYVDHIRITVYTAEADGVAVGSAAGAATAAAVGNVFGQAVGSATGSATSAVVGAGPGLAYCEGVAEGLAVGNALVPAVATASSEGMSAASGAGAVGSRIVAGVVKSISVSNGLVVAARGGTVGAVDVTAGEVPTITSVPSTATSTGTTGQIAYDTSYLYVCVATNTWRRVAIVSW